MRRALATLLRVRAAEKKLVQQDFAVTERARFQQEDRVEAIREAVLRSHTGDAEGYASGEAVWLAQEHSYRLRMQVRLRREVGVLQQRTAESNRARELLVEADRAARVVEIALEKHDAEVALQERRADARRIDAMATVRWWRENG